MANNPEKQTALMISGGMHILLLALVIFGLPVLFEITREPEPMAISVEILPVAAISNVKPSEAKPSEKENPKEQEKPQEQPKPAEPEKLKPKPTPPVKEKEKTLEDIVGLEPKKPDQPKKPQEKKDKQKETDADFDALINLDKNASQSKSEKADKKDPDSSSSSKSKSDRYNPDLPLSLGEMDLVRSQIAKCWNMPAGSADAGSLKVVIKAQYNADGSVIAAEIKSSGAGGVWQSAAESARRAVLKCSPLQNLPADKFQTWKDMEITFDPSMML